MDITLIKLSPSFIFGMMNQFLIKKIFFLDFVFFLTLFEDNILDYEPFKRREGSVTQNVLY